MELTDFPRPPNDNGRGVHWASSVYEWGKSNWDFWKDQLQAMHIKWVKILDDGGGSGLRLARRLVDLEIMPVVRFYWPHQNPGTIGSRGAGAVKLYLQAGVCYFETNNEPDLALEWQGGVLPEDWLDQVVDNFIKDADSILELGGFPAVPAFGVGTQRDPFRKIADRGRLDILHAGAWAALHNYCLGRPLDYPNDQVNTQGIPLTPQEWEDAGGWWAWEMPVDQVNQSRAADTHPDADIMSDSTCFRAFEQLNALVVQACGHSIPILTTEGGYNVGQRAGTTFGDDPRYPKPTPELASRLNRDMFKFLQGDTEICGRNAPDYYFACMPWLIAAYRINVWATPAEAQGPWFTHQYDRDFGLKGELPLVQMLKDTPPRVRQNGPVPSKSSKGIEWAKTDHELELGDKWDHRFKYLGIDLHRVQPTNPGGLTNPYWKIVQAAWQDEDEVECPGYVFVRVLDQAGNPIESATVTIARAGSASSAGSQPSSPRSQPGAYPMADQVKTKGAVDNYRADYAMRASLGTYSVFADHAGYPSEVITGLGLGLEDDLDLWTRTSFTLTFQLTDPRTPRTPEVFHQTSGVLPVTQTEPVGAPLVGARENEEEPPMLDIAAYNHQYITTPANQAADFGVQVLLAKTSEVSTEPLYRCIGGHHLSGRENGGNHHVYVDILDTQGRRVRNAVLGWTWQGRKQSQQAAPIALEKPDDEPGWNVALGFDQTASVWVQDANGRVASDVVANLHTRHGDTDEGNTNGHHSFYLVFQEETTTTETVVPTAVSPEVFHQTSGETAPTTAAIAERLDVVVLELTDIITLLTNRQ